MSSVFELAVIRPHVGAEPLRGAVKAAIDATGWRRGSSDVTIFAYQLTPDAVIVEHRATSSPTLGAATDGRQTPINPFSKHVPRVEHFYIELGARLAPSGCRTLATVTSDQVGEWAVYAIDRESLAAHSSRSLPERLFGFGRLPPSVLQAGYLNPDGFDTAAHWLSSALDINPPLPNMAKFHDWLTELWYGSTLDQWLLRIVLQPICVIRSGRILSEAETVDATELLRDEALR